MTELRPYQQEAMKQLEASRSAGCRAPLLVLPTGGGKTRIAAELIRSALSAGQRSIFLAPRRELVVQASRALAREGIGHGVILAGADAAGGLYSSVQVASIDTLLSRAVRRSRIEVPAAELVIVDEAHLSITQTRQDLLSLWPRAVRVGLTATPTRKDGRALGLIYDDLVEPVTVSDLQRDGYLCKARYFSVAEPDLARVRTVAGDYNEGDLEGVMNQPKLVGDVVEHWLRLAAKRRTVVFATSIKHSVALCEAFMRCGVAAEHVDADTPQVIRDAAFERFTKGDTQVFCNCFLASYGFDLPELDCVVLARPTKSLMLYLQMIGRGLRTAEGKSDCLVLDHSGCVHRHGFAHTERRWTLEGDRALIERQKTAREKREQAVLTCPECDCAFSGARLCPECGYYFGPKGKDVVTLDGELVEVGERLKREQQDRLAFFTELRGIAYERQFKPGWAAHRYREKFNEWPPDHFNSAPLAQPTVETRRWLKSRMIAWVKSQQQQSNRVISE